jgi:hypothetical protein
MSSENQKPLLATARNPNGGFDSFDNPDAPQLFMDGVAQYSIGPAVTKLRFFQIKNMTDENGLSIENREVTLVLAIPTFAFFELISGLKPQLGPRMDDIEKQTNELIKQIKSSIG